ncbi:MAG TPA: DNA polymerase III subunit delta [Clostridiales bacterium]|nr:DNA polymerase III subunit delta [Clostridiales bacterium]
MAKITEADLKEHIKVGNFSNLYLIYGEEKMLVRVYTNRLRDKIIGREPSDFNLHTFNEDSSLNRIVEAMDILPFAQPTNYVEILDINLDKPADGEIKDFFKALENISPTTTVVISMMTAKAAGKKQSRWKKLIDIAAKYGSAVNLEKRTATVLKKQLITWANKQNVTLTGANADLIIQYSGNDLQTLHNEMEKLCAFVQTGEITENIIEKLVTKNLEARVFDMADAVLKGDYDSAYSKLDLLFYQREEPVNILAVLSSSYVDMYRVRVMMESGEQPQRLTEYFDYKRKEFRINKAQRSGKGLSNAALEESLGILAETNAKINSTSVNKKILLEELVGKLIMVGKRS